MIRIWNSGTVPPKNWRNQFDLLKVSPTHYLKALNEMIRKMPDALAKVLSEFEQKYGLNPFLPEYKSHQLKLIRRNAQLMKLNS